MYNTCMLTIVVSRATNGANQIDARGCLDGGSISFTVVCFAAKFFLLGISPTSHYTNQSIICQFQ